MEDVKKRRDRIARDLQDRILKIVDLTEEMDRSDLQGACMVLAIELANVIDAAERLKEASMDELDGDDGSDPKRYALRDAETGYIAARHALDLDI